MIRLSIIIFFTLTINVAFSQKKDTVAVDSVEIIDVEEPTFLDGDEDSEKEIQDYFDMVDKRTRAAKAKKEKGFEIPSEYMWKKIWGDFHVAYNYNKRDKNNKILVGLLKKGKVHLPLIYNIEYLGGYSSDTREILFELEGKFGLYNVEKEEWTIPLKYKELEKISNEIYKARDGKYLGLIDNFNNVLLDFDHTYIWELDQNKGYFHITYHKEGQYFQGIYNGNERKMLIPPIYSSISSMYNRKTFTVQNVDKKFNIIDFQNRLIFQNWYELLSKLGGDELSFIAKKEGKMGIIDIHEKTIVPFENQIISNRPFMSKFLVVLNNENKCGVINLKGKTELPFIYDCTLNTKYLDYIIASKNNKFGMIGVENNQPSEIVEFEYDTIIDKSDFLIVGKNDLYGFMDRKGKFLTDLKFSEIRQISSRHILATLNGEGVILNSLGEILIQENYKSIEILRNKKYRYRSRLEYILFFKAKLENDKYVLLNDAGNRVKGIQFDDLLERQGDWILAKKNGKYGVYNIKTNMVQVSFEFDQIIFTRDKIKGVKSNDEFLISIINGVTEIEKL